VLNTVFLCLATALVWRYFRQGGGLRMLNCIRRVFRPEGGFRRWAS
jgi:hypothetical protein